MNFSESFINQIKDHISLASLISKHTKLVRKGKYHKGCCPFHTEKTASFIVDEANGSYHCFGCQAHGDAISYLVNREGYDFIGAIKFLAERAGIELPKFTQSHDNLLYECLEEASLWFTAQLYGNAGQEARSYLRKRSFKKSIVDEFRLGYAPSGTGLQQHLLAKEFPEQTLIDVGLLGRDENSGRVYNKFRNRLMFPIDNKRGKIIAFGGRILDKGEPKYLNSPETELFQKGHHLYGMYIAASRVKSDHKPFIVCEGYTDVLALHQAGIRTAVAPLGTALTEVQIDLMWQKDPTSPPLLCFDGDTAGQNAAHKAALRVLPMIKDLKTLYFVRLPAGDDPASLLEQNRNDEIHHLLSQGQELQDFIWTWETDNKSFEKLEEKAQLKTTLLTYVQAIKDSTLKNIYKNRFIERYYEFLRSLNRRLSNKPHNLTRINFPRRQQILFVLAVVHHPELLNDFFDDFMLIDFSETILDELRKQIIEKINSNDVIEHDELYAHLSDMGHKITLDDMLKELLNQVKFIHPDTAYDDVKKGWQESWALFRQKYSRSDSMNELIKIMENRNEINNNINEPK